MYVYMYREPSYCDDDTHLYFISLHRNTLRIDKSSLIIITQVWPQNVLHHIYLFPKDFGLPSCSNCCRTIATTPAIRFLFDTAGSNLNFVCHAGIKPKQHKRRTSLRLSTDVTIICSLLTP